MGAKVVWMVWAQNDDITTFCCSHSLCLKLILAYSHVMLYMTLYVMLYMTLYVTLYVMLCVTL